MRVRDLSDEACVGSKCRAGWSVDDFRGASRGFRSCRFELRQKARRMRGGCPATRDFCAPTWVARQRRACSRRKVNALMENGRSRNHLRQNPHLANGLIDHRCIRRTLAQKARDLIAGADDGVEFGIGSGNISAQVDQVFRLPVERERFANLPGVVGLLREWQAATADGSPNRAPGSPG